MGNFLLLLVLSFITHSLTIHGLEDNEENGEMKVHDFVRIVRQSNSEQSRSDGTSSGERGDRRQERQISRSRHTENGERHIITVDRDGHIVQFRRPSLRRPPSPRRLPSSSRLQSRSDRRFPFFLRSAPRQPPTLNSSNSLTHQSATVMHQHATVTRSRATVTPGVNGSFGRQQSHFDPAASLRERMDSLNGGGKRRRIGVGRTIQGNRRVTSRVRFRLDPSREILHTDSTSIPSQERVFISTSRPFRPLPSRRPIMRTSQLNGGDNEFIPSTRFTPPSIPILRSFRPHHPSPFTLPPRFSSTFSTTPLSTIPSTTQSTITTSFTRTSSTASLPVTFSSSLPPRATFTIHPPPSRVTSSTLFSPTTTSPPSTQFTRPSTPLISTRLTTGPTPPPSTHPSSILPTSATTPPAISVHVLPPSIPSEVEENSINGPLPPSTPLTTIKPSSTVVDLMGAPPGELPPSDNIVRMLNDADDFIEMARRLNITRKAALKRRRKRMAEYFRWLL